MIWTHNLKTNPLLERVPHGETDEVGTRTDVWFKTTAAPLPLSYIGLETRYYSPTGFVNRCSLTS